MLGAYILSTLSFTDCLSYVTEHLGQNIHERNMTSILRRLRQKIKTAKTK